MRPWQRHALALILVGISALVITPRSWLHHCGQEQVSHRHPDAATLYGELNCDVCEVVVALFDDEVLIPSVPPSGEQRFAYLPTTVQAVFRSVGSPTSRGPPSC